MNESSGSCGRYVIRAQGHLSQWSLAEVAPSCPHNIDLRKTFIDPSYDCVCCTIGHTVVLVTDDGVLRPTIDYGQCV
jgi:hypothetical protein